MKVSAEFDFTPTPEELAYEFCHLYQEGQARFLNRVAELFNRHGYCLSTQLEYVTQSKELNIEGRALMSKLGEYAEHNK